MSADIIVLYKIIKDISTPFDKLPAYDLGIIDEKGKLIKKPSGSKEKKAYGIYDRFIINIKRILAKSGLSGKAATFAGAMLLIREGYEEELTEKQLTEKFESIYNEVLSESREELEMLEEEIDSILDESIANVTGPAVAGTGDTGDVFVHKHKVGVPGERRKFGKCINGIYYLKRAARNARLKEKARLEKMEKDKCS